ncbi:MAG: hypothetical protein HYY06_07755 [Deltaproteobacteria bacterium]|nr:hypothetical protein [Deltaproteobacteria bacterium]
MCRDRALTGAVLGVAIAMGCAGNGRAPGEVDGNAELFAAEVQPVLARRCAYLGCHGREGMPLTIYAVDFLRLRDPQGQIDFSRPPLDELALSPAELEHNRMALASRAGPEDPNGTLVLRRMLPLDEGGIPHAGVVVFDRGDDPELMTLSRFMGTVHAR